MPKIKKDNKPRIKKEKKTKEVLIGKPEHQMDSLNLIEVQKESWQRFLNFSLTNILNEFFPIIQVKNLLFILKVYILENQDILCKHA